MNRCYFEPIDIEIKNREIFQADWKSLQKAMLNLGIKLPDICRILNVDKNGFVIEQEVIS